MRGRKPNLQSDAGAIRRSPAAPSHLSKAAKAEWRRVMPALVERKILTTPDVGSVENYCVAMGRIREIEELIAKSGLSPDLFRMSNASMQTARQLAAELGLTPVSRSRPTMRPDPEGDDGDNPLLVS